MPKILIVEDEAAIRRVLKKIISEENDTYEVEEAEDGLSKALLLGNYELNTWLNRSDLLLLLGETEAAIINLKDAMDFYPENAEIEFRLAGLHFYNHNFDAADFHFTNGLNFDAEFMFIVEELFPPAYTSDRFTAIINQFKFNN